MTLQAVVSCFLNKLADPLIQRAGWFQDVRREMEWVQSQFRWTQAFLKDAEDKSYKDARVQVWIQDVRNLAYLAEDIIETFEVEVAPSIHRAVSGTNARSKLISEIDRMRDKFRTIAESRVTYGIQDLGREEGSSCRDTILLPSNGDEPDLVGFQADFEQLILQLIEGEQRRSVISIVGMGGQGKTTLARKLYRSDKSLNHFHHRLWISLSQVYGAAEIMQAVMKKYMDISTDNLDTVELRDKISQHLEQKRYLVVLDDLWTWEAWNDLKDAFPNTSNGSRVLITTRNKDVALYADAKSEPHKLRFLNDEESWELFFKSEFWGCQPNLGIDSQQLEKDIISKCRGLPLAIVVIRGLLSRRKEPREWQHILRSISWQLIEGEHQISGILSMSYRDLPCFLKPCFLYLGIFPEDCEIPAKKLIRLWLAEGFLSERGNLTLEEVGEDYLRELLQRSLIQVTERSSNRAIKSCRIHDVVREFAISKAKKEAFLNVHIFSETSELKEGRRLAVHHDKRAEFSQEVSFDFLNPTTDNLRSLLFSFHKNYVYTEEKRIAQGFKLLRVLDIQGVVLQNLPSEVGDLIHLRYLGCHVQAESLPPNLSRLVNLQTLCISHSLSIKIPIVLMVGMQNLRHVRVGNADCWIGIEGRPCFDKLRSSNLQTLKKVVAGEWMNEECLGRWKKLKNLGIDVSPRGAPVGKIWEWIMGLESLESLHVKAQHVDLGQFPLKNLDNLWKLRLEGKLENPPVLQELPKYLNKLILEGSHLQEDALPILGKLKDLRILQLGKDFYVGERMASSKGWFPRLQWLSIAELPHLREWRIEEGSMPCLLRLVMSGCPNLKEVPDLQHLPTLKMVEIHSMNSEFEVKEKWERTGIKCRTYPRLL